MKTLRSDYPARLLCLVLAVSRSGFYDWMSRPASCRSQFDERLKIALKAAHQRTRETYGSRRMQSELKADGFVAGRDRIARLRRSMHIFCKQKRKFKATTNSNHDFPVAENLLNQVFAPTAPNQVWVTDITY
jgi:transposase InsO family protein